MHGVDEILLCAWVILMDTSVGLLIVWIVLIEVVL